MTVKTDSVALGYTSRPRSPKAVAKAGSRCCAISAGSQPGRGVGLSF
jgi:hypothetical protein